MALGQPSADAYMFVIDAGSAQYDAYFDAVTIGDDLHVGDVRYRPIGSASSVAWTPISSIGGGADTDNEFDSNRMTTTEDTYAEMDSVLANMSQAIELVFGGSGGEAPASGIDLIRFMLKNNMVSESNNVLTRIK